MECRSADFYVCVPESCRAVRCGRDFERVESVGRLVAGLPHKELTLRRIDVYGSRVAVRNLLVAVKNHRKVKCVTWSPDPAFSINVSFQAFLKCLAAGIESAQRFFVSVVYFQICFRSGLFCIDNERLTLQLDFCHAVTLALGLTDFLQLIVVDCYLCAGYRFCRVYVTHACPKRTAVSVFRCQCECGCHEVSSREVVIHVI